MAMLAVTSCEDRAQKQIAKGRALRAVYNAGIDTDDARRRADRVGASPADHEEYRASLDRLKRRKQDAMDIGLEEWKVENEALTARVDATSERTARTLASAKRRDAREQAEEDEGLK